MVAGSSVRANDLTKQRADSPFFILHQRQLFVNINLEFHWDVQGTSYTRWQIIKKVRPKMDLEYGLLQMSRTMVPNSTQVVILTNRGFGPVRGLKKRFYSEKWG